MFGGGPGGIIEGLFSTICTTISKDVAMKTRPGTRSSRIIIMMVVKYVSVSEYISERIRYVKVTAGEQP